MNYTLVKKTEDEPNYISDSEGNISFIDSKKFHSLISNWPEEIILNDKRDLRSFFCNDDYSFIIEKDNKLGILSCYEIAWESYISDEKMISLENKFLIKLKNSKLKSEYESTIFYLSRHEDNCENSLCIKAITLFEFANNEFLNPYSKSKFNKISKDIFEFAEIDFDY